MTLIFSIHYFLWYGALTSFLSFEGVYSRHYANATPMQFGYLYMALPFTTMLTTPVICSLADRKRAHRSIFTLSTLVVAISICMFTMLPLLMDQQFYDQQAHPPTNPKEVRPAGDLRWGPWIFFCLVNLVLSVAMGVSTCLSDSFAVLQAEESNTNFGSIIVWGTFGWAASAATLSGINQISALPRLTPGLLFGSVLLTIDVALLALWPHPADFKLDSIPAEAAQTLTGSSSSGHKSASDYLPLNESVRINLGVDIDVAQDGTMSVVRKTKSPIRMALEGEQSENLTVIDSSALDEQTTIKTIDSESGVEPKQGADSRSSGSSASNTLSAGFGLPSSVTLKANKLLDTSGFGEPKQASDPTKDRAKEAPASDAVAQKRAPGVLGAPSFRMQFLMLWLILQRRRSLLRYLILFCLAGFFMSIHWNYFFLFLEQIHFAHFALISGLSMVSQSLLGELPFFILSRKIINGCGRSYTLSISIISIGVRLLIYGYLLPGSSPLMIILADIFQGPNYGLFYVVMTEIGLEYSYCDDETIEALARRGEIDRNDKRQVDSMRLALRSTIQSVAFACYEGVGVGLGSLVGGWLLNSYGFETLWTCMAAGAIAVGFVNILIELLCREHDPEAIESERKEYMEARRRGSLRPLGSLRPPSGSRTRQPRARLASPAPARAPQQPDKTQQQQHQQQQQQQQKPKQTDQEREQLKLQQAMRLRLQHLQPVQPDTGGAQTGQAPASEPAGRPVAPSGVGPKREDSAQLGGQRA